MKLNQLRKGFTLVEIMIVVVIIGILATLAVPALKKARNSANEKTLFNDARQISSAANQYFADTGKTNVTVGGLVGANNYLSSLSSGTLIAQSSGPVNALTVANNLWSSQAGLNVILATSSDPTTANSVFRLGNIGYDTVLSSTPAVIDPLQGAYNVATATNPRDIGLVFAVETGTLLQKSATTAAQTAAYH